MTEATREKGALRDAEKRSPAANPNSAVTSWPPSSRSSTEKWARAAIARATFAAAFMQNWATSGCGEIRRSTLASACSIEHWSKSWRESRSGSPMGFRPVNQSHMRPRPVDHEYKERLPRSMFSLRLGGGYIGFCELAILLTPRAATNPQLNHAEAREQRCDLRSQLIIR